MSRAVVTWPESGRPDALRNVVPRMPSARAFCVMSSAKWASDPPTASARAIAMSFADLVINALIASMTAICSPGSRSSLVGCAEAASWLTLILVDGDSLPNSSCSNTM